MLYEAFIRVETRRAAVSRDFARGFDGFRAAIQPPWKCPRRVQLVQLWFDLGPGRSVRPRCLIAFAIYTFFHVEAAKRSQIKRYKRHSASRYPHVSEWKIVDIKRNGTWKKVYVFMRVYVCVRALLCRKLTGQPRDVPLKLSEALTVTVYCMKSLFKRSQL